jgi:hypothetical protein
MKKKFFLLIGSLLSCLLFFISGWFLGRADHTAQTSSFAARAGVVLASNYEEKRERIPDYLFTLIDSSVLSMDSVLPLVIDPEKRKQIQETYIKVAAFREKHPEWLQYYNGSTLPFEKDDTIIKRMDAILSKAKDRKNDG